MTSQVGNVFEKLKRFGESKYKYKKQYGGKSKFYHNPNTFKDHLRKCKNFVKWTREEYGIKSIYNLEPHHHQAYVEYLEDREDITPGHIVNVETALSKLQDGMEVAAEERGKEPVHFFVNRLVRNSQKPSDRSYSKEEIQILKRNMSEEAEKAAFFSLKFGLRAREAANIRVEHLDLQRDRIYIPDKKEAQKLNVTPATGITKGGRYREIPITKKETKKRLEKMLQGKSAKDCIVGIKVGSLRKELGRTVKKANLASALALSDGKQIKNKGWHGFRHTFARERLLELDKGGKARETLEKALVNRDNGYRPNLGIRQEDYREMKEKVNVVLSELGHGGDRWQLIETYLK